MKKRTLTIMLCITVVAAILMIVAILFKIDLLMYIATIVCSISATLLKECIFED